MDYSRYQLLKVEKEGKVAIITLNRPEMRNAINPPLHDELEEIFGDVGRDDDVNAIVLTGAGTVFCGGGDIGRMGAERQVADVLARPSTRTGRRLVHAMLGVEQPIVAAVNGHAIGLGATLALFSDIIIASEKAKIGDPHVAIGLVAGDGGAVIWPLLCGLARAKEYLLTGDLVPAPEAERIGLINHAVPPDQVMPRAMEIARRLAGGATRAIRWTKLACNKHLFEGVNLVLDASLATETLTFLTEDHREAAKAFAEKRKPEFKGR